MSESARADVSHQDVNGQKTLEKVKTEMSLHMLAYNLKRMINILGVRPLR